MSDQPIGHLICNAHIDPVSTFGTAADPVGAFPGFIFNHNQSVLYEWVEEYDPPLFERIRVLVKDGQWHISGGWYLQPDVNLPEGETLVRCILEGRRYFRELFDEMQGVDVRSSNAARPKATGHACGRRWIKRRSKRCPMRQYLT